VPISTIRPVPRPIDNRLDSKNVTVSSYPGLCPGDEEGLMPQVSLALQSEVPQQSRVPQSEVTQVSWTPQADSDLQVVVSDPAIRDQIKRNAETLHEVEALPGGDRRSEGFEGEVMWHRGWTHEQELRASWLPEQADDGPWNYVVFYRRTVGPADFEVLAVRSRVQLADCIWEQIHNGI
jgi:hypothetical protein